MRTVYALRSLYQLKHASLDPAGRRDYWQAGKSVEHVHRVETAATIMQRFARALANG